MRSLQVLKGLKVTKTTGRLNAYCEWIALLNKASMVRHDKCIKGAVPCPKTEYSPAAARSAQCWSSVDRVSGDLATTDWRRLARWRQCQWRMARGYPIGSNPYAGGMNAAPAGSRLDLDFAMSCGANFLTNHVLAFVWQRLAQPEPLPKPERLWADLLSSMPLAFNLFGHCAGAGFGGGAPAVRAWWPAAPGAPSHLRFEHSPGRLDPTFLGDRTAFDVAFELKLGPRLRGMIGIETKYHEHARREAPPKNPARYIEVTERSGVFKDGWQTAILGTELQQTWRDHLLLLSMLQHPSHRWKWGIFVLAYPAANLSYERVARRYREVLRDPATFEARTLEDLTETPGALAPEVRAAFVERYLS